MCQHQDCSPGEAVLTPHCAERGRSGAKEPPRAWIRQVVVPSLGHYCAGLLSFSEMLLCWPELRNGPRAGALNNAGIFLFPVLCFQTETAPPAVQGEVLGTLAKAGWSRGFSLTLQLTVPGS